MLGGAPNVSWKAKSGDYTKMRVKMNVLESNNDTAYYFSTEAFFKDGRVGYIGMQPRKGKNQHLTFSVFGKNTSGVDLQHCKGGADWGAGTSCATDYPWVIQKEYICEIKLISSNETDHTWVGNFIDADTDKVLTTIGVWTTPAYAGLIQGHAISFDEFYVWNTGKWHGDSPATRPCQPISTVKIWAPVFFNDQGQAFPSTIGTVSNAPATARGDKCAVAQDRSNVEYTIEDNTITFRVGFLKE